MNFGLPYKGSKNRIAEEIVAMLPPADCLVDVFAGGCAISHAALLSGKFGRVVANDIRPEFPELFKAAISGNLPKGYDRYVSREAFHARKTFDAVAACIWSFGTNCNCYLWSAEIERAMGLAFRLITSESRDERGRLYGEFIESLSGGRRRLEELQSAAGEREEGIKRAKERLRGILRGALEASGLTQAGVDRHLGTNGMAGHYFGASQWMFPTPEAYEKLREILPLPERSTLVGDLRTLSIWDEIDNFLPFASLDGFRQLNAISRIRRLEELADCGGNAECLFTSGKDYRDLEVPNGALVYCDPPYDGTDEYAHAFDSAKFFDWARKMSASHIVAISEYAAPDDFAEVWSAVKTCFLCGGKPKRTVERLFVHKSALEQFERARPGQRALELAG